MIKNITPSNSQHCKHSTEVLYQINQITNFDSFNRSEALFHYLDSSLINCDIEHINILIDNKLTPYPEENTYNFEELTLLGDQYFSKHAKYSQYFALSIHDWTTNNFFRKKILTHYKYSYNPNFSANTGHDVESIAKIFLASNWYNFTAYNKNFAESFFLYPIPRNFTKEEV